MMWLDKRQFGLGLLAAFLAMPAAHAATPSTAGTWQGSVKGRAVVVCLAEYDGAAYYFQSDRAIHPLRGGDGEWTETPGPQWVWTLQPVRDGHLAGELKTDEGQPAGTVQLQRIAPAPGQGGCHAAFYAPLLAKEREVRRPAEFEGHAYELLKSAHGQTLLWPDDLPGAARFNAFSRRWLREVSLADYRLAACGGARDGQSRLRPKAWNATWLVLSDGRTGLFCSDGFGIGFAGGGYLTVDLATGDQVDTWTWLKHGEALGQSRAPESTAPLALRRLIEQRSRWGHGQCDPASSWLGQPYPTRTGLVFDARQGRHGDICVEDILVPWQALSAHLTQAGREAMQRSLSP